MPPDTPQQTDSSADARPGGAITPGPLRLRPLHGRAKPVTLREEPVTIGRHPDNTISLKDERVSRNHAVIEPVGDTWYIRDLESRNGVRVNGKKSPTVMLRPGDVLKIGKHEFAVELVGAPESSDRAGSEKPSPSRAKRSESSGPWREEFERVLRELTPKAPGGESEPLESISLLSASGAPSEVLETEGPGAVAVTLLLRIASRARATDIHIEPKSGVMHARMRVDGQMIWIGEFPTRVGELALGLIKAACLMKPAARDSVQDGHFSAKVAGRRVESRVSITPTVNGPKGVLRVLDSLIAPRSIEEVGLLGYMADRVKRTVNTDNGLLLVCGPTGSGKTTTLYNALREIDRDARNVITIEDPVEYTIDGVTQLPVDEEHGKGFHDLLRSVLRQDPDVILVGEIRDELTAAAAMRAAMTGHLVFSTVHAKDTISAIFRLLDLGVEPYLVASSLDIVLAQRLVRVLCEHCKRRVDLHPGQVTRMGRHLGGKVFSYEAVGCARCLSTGYKGRRAIFELLDVNDELRDVILGSPSVQAIKKVIDGGLFTTLAQFGYRMVADGVTSVAEVDRVAGDT